METAFKTDCGKIRAHNEDSGGVFYNRTDRLLAVVADGVGGHRAGDVASALALDLIKENWEKTEESLSDDEAEKWLHETIKNANTQILSYADEHPECQGMGTTIVAAICAPEFAAIAHVGDSRCYLLEGNSLRQVTKDHTLVNELVRQGKISKEDAAVHPQKHVILQALGTEESVDPETQTIHWNPENIVLLCSDGLTDQVEDKKLEDILLRESSLQDKADMMIDQANAAGGGDNITLSLIHFPATDHSMPEDSDGDIKENESGNEETLSTEERNG